jgi:hypothetical protein
MDESGYFDRDQCDELAQILWRWRGRASRPGSRDNGRMQVDGLKRKFRNIYLIFNICIFLIFYFIFLTVGKGKFSQMSLLSNAS